MLVWRKILAHGLKRLATPGLHHQIWHAVACGWMINKFSDEVLAEQIHCVSTADLSFPIRIKLIAQFTINSHETYLAIVGRKFELYNLCIVPHSSVVHLYNEIRMLEMHRRFVH